jgi:hypothetical protein
MKIEIPFDLANPGAEVIRSTFGGGWIIPLTPAASMALADFFDEEPAELAPLGGRAGYIVEPNQAGDLAEYLRGAGIAWKVN